MRMRRKSRLDERLAACSSILTVADNEEKNMALSAQKRDIINFSDIFKNSNPLRLEIGCGKGGFVLETAKRYKDINFVAVEKISNVLVEACESAQAANLTNVYFINSAAEVLPRYLPEKAFETLYLNFSNPLPKLGYVKQRLTHPRFLEEYKLFLKDGGEIIQKTDDKNFYLFSLESMRECDYEIIDLCEDLESLCDPDNVMTEHEKRFSEMGKPIYRIVARLK